MEQGQTKVGDPKVVFAVQKKVGGLDVAVDHAELVGMLQGVRGRQGEVGHPAKESEPIGGTLSRERQGCRGYRPRRDCSCLRPRGRTHWAGYTSLGSSQVLPALCPRVKWRRLVGGAARSVG